MDISDYIVQLIKKPFTTIGNAALFFEKRLLTYVDSCSSIAIWFLLSSLLVSITTLEGDSRPVPISKKSRLGTDIVAMTNTNALKSDVDTNPLRIKLNDDIKNSVKADQLTPDNVSTKLAMVDKMLKALPLTLKEKFLLRSYFLKNGFDDNYLNTCCKYFETNQLHHLADVLRPDKLKVAANKYVQKTAVHINNTKQQPTSVKLFLSISATDFISNAVSGTTHPYLVRIGLAWSPIANATQKPIYTHVSDFVQTSVMVDGISLLNHFRQLPVISNDTFYSFRGTSESVGYDLHNNVFNSFTRFISSNFTRRSTIDVLSDNLNNVHISDVNDNSTHNTPTPAPAPAITTTLLQSPPAFPEMTSNDDTVLNTITNTNTNTITVNNNQSIENNTVSANANTLRASFTDVVGKFKESGIIFVKIDIGKYFYIKLN